MARSLVPGRLSVCAPLPRSWRPRLHFRTDQQLDVRLFLRVRVDPDDNRDDAAQQYSSAGGVPLYLPITRKPAATDSPRGIRIPGRLARLWRRGLRRHNRNWTCGQRTDLDTEPLMDAHCGHFAARRTVPVQSSQIPMPGQVPLTLQLHCGTLARRPRTRGGFPPWC